MKQQLDPDNTVYEEISEGRDNMTIGNRVVNMRGYVASVIDNFWSNLF